MRIVALLQANLDVTPIGTRSRLATELAGVPVLRRTVSRISRAKLVQDVYVVAPPDQVDRCRNILAGSGAEVRADDAPAPGWSSLVRSARKWSLDAWRGGVGQTTVFDEFADCGLVARFLDQEKADAVLVVPPSAPLIDPVLADAMIHHWVSVEPDARVVITQTPPGLSGILLTADIARELAEKNIPVGWIMSYQPDTPKKDLIFEPCYCESPTEVRHAAGRLMADTERACVCLADLFRDHQDPDGPTVGRWLTERGGSFVDSLPREVEIELTTCDPYPDTLVRARGSRVNTRGPIDAGIVGRVAKELAAWDDSLVVLGGFGDPLRHPALGDVLAWLRPVDDNGIYGLAVRTTAVDLQGELMESLVSHGVDILNVTLDAWTPELYARLHAPLVAVESGAGGGDTPTVMSDPAVPDLAAVLANLESLAAWQRKNEAAAPIVVPEMTKTRDNVCEQDEFFDGWIRRNGTAVISGPSHHAGQCEDRSVIRMAPSVRSPCRRIRERCLILADGRVVFCDQDLNGRHALGSLLESSLEELWQGGDFESLRQSHREGDCEKHTLCAKCDDWHRP